ncbi:MAG: RNA-binding S4 domain-containing protein [Alphaproteobacteria bacterium]|nr:RNA-binding S4 domain-containing protein [Alphaproteobacteria bacterium]
MTQTPGLRIDKWLWYARFFKSRSLAAELCGTGRIRVNGNRITKPHALVRPGDVVTFPKGPHVRVVRIEGLGTRRGPAVEAATLYEDLAPPQPGSGRRQPRPAAQARRLPGSGRPTKSERRATDRLKGR